LNDKNKLGLIYPGLYQITSKKIMIFGGMQEFNEEDEELMRGIESNRMV